MFYTGRSNFSRRSGHTAKSVSHLLCYGLSLNGHGHICGVAHRSQYGVVHARRAIANMEYEFCSIGFAVWRKLRNWKISSPQT